MLGQEGPMVHIVCCVSNFFIRLFPKYHDNEGNKRKILLAGSAAGVSLSFNAPITGVLFSLEETSFYFSSSSLWKSFFLSLVGVFFLSCFLPYSDQGLSLYKITEAHWHIFELPIFAFIGVLGGLCGAIFTKSAIIWNKLKQKLWVSRFPITEVVIVTLITSLICFPSDFSRHRVLHKFENLSPYGVNASMYILREMKGVSLTLCLKFILLIFTFSLKVPSGIFVPSVVLGSLMGRIIGLAIEYHSINYPHFYIFKLICSTNHRCIYPSLYAIVGGAAVLGGVTQMTVCVVVMMVEITGQLNYILPLILTVIMAKWVSNALLKHGMFRVLYLYLAMKRFRLSITIHIFLTKKKFQTPQRPLITIPIEGIDLH
ncbi:hypothetical protein MXB_1876, partial [Myxobolus squamalis]